MTDNEAMRTTFERTRPALHEDEAEAEAEAEQWRSHGGVWVGSNPRPLL